MATPLSRSNLARIASTTAVPKYDPAAVSPGIVHFGVGNFHRAHMAVYLDDLFNTGRDLDWGIVGAGVLAADARARDTLAAQDWLTTVVEQEADRSIAHVTAPMVDYLPPADAGAIVDALVDPEIRIVSLTITEGGYFIDPATGAFNPNDPAIAADASDPANPRTVFGMIVAGLSKRRAAGTPPFTVMSCDNIPHNGRVTRNAVVGLASLFDPGLADWIGEEVAFPNGMVDRITPATTDRERCMVAEDFGITDNWPVYCEGFRQWVLEDRFPAGRPAFEAVGVEFVDDVSPFETMKIRILNGGHALIGYPAGLLDIEFVHQAMDHPLIRAFLRKVTREEIIPIIPPVPRTDLANYAAIVEKRFSNPKIGDTVRRICLDGSNRQPKFIIPSIADRLRQGLDAPGLALGSALWCRYCAGTTESGATIAPNDPDWDRLNAAARAAQAEPEQWLALDDIYGAIESDTFREKFASTLQELWQDGTQRVLERYVAEPRDRA